MPASSSVASSNRISLLRWALIFAIPLLIIQACSSDEVPSLCPTTPETMRFGFYDDYPPVSSLQEITDGPQHAGYEADLLSAMTQMQGTNLRFDRSPISKWPGIWLLPASDDFDIVGGGISILDSRTRNPADQAVVTFTGGHIDFRSSLLVRQTDASRIDAVSDLQPGDRVGVYADTTSESWILNQLNFVDANGALRAGTRVVLPAGEIETDGSNRYAITAAGSSPALAGRSQIEPAGDGPTLVYLDASSLDYLATLDAGDVDAIADDAVATQISAQRSEGQLVVVALGSDVSRGGFVLAAGDDHLRCLNHRIGWLTDNGNIGLPEWLADPDVFSHRAQLWNRSNRD